MKYTPRPAPFVLISSYHGSLIINRNDVHRIDEKRAYGVGHQIMTASCYDPAEVGFVRELLRLRRHYHGNGVTAVDCGANIGVHSIEWARLMHGWGHVWSFEAQEKIYYALAGNIALNNCLNVTARLAAVGAEVGEMEIPEPDYLRPASFGSLELKPAARPEFIGQQINYTRGKTRVPLVSLDSLGLPRADFIKMDVEGMEEEALAGAAGCIEAHHPALVVEVVKSDRERLRSFLIGRFYAVFDIGMNFLAVHQDDPALKHLKSVDGKVTLSRLP